MAEGTPVDSPARLRPIQGLMDVILAAGANWTVSSNLSYLAGWSLRTASLLSAAGLAVAAVLFLRFARRDAAQSADSPPVCDLDNAEAPHDRADLLLVAAAVVGLAVWAAVSRSYLVFWLISVPLLGIGYWRVVRLRPGVTYPAPGLNTRPEPCVLARGPRSTAALLAVLGAAAVTATMVVHRANPDDCFYLNRAAMLADGFSESMRVDFGIFEKPTPIPYCSFPLMAFHDFIGLLSWATGLQPLEVSTWIIAPAGALLVVAAYALLCQTLFGPRWDWALVGALVPLLAGAPTIGHFAAHGFLRIWQGKAILLHVGLPLVAATGLRYGLFGRRRDLLRLAGAAVCAAGLSSTGMWLFPAWAVLAVLSGLRHRRDWLPRLAATMAALAYPLIEGLLTYGRTMSDVGYRQDLRSFEDVLSYSFGAPVGLLAWLAVFLLGPLLAGWVWARRYLMLGVLCVLLTFMNPTLRPLVCRYVTSGVVFWRVHWVLPALPVLAASVMLAGFRIGSPRVRAVSGPVVWCLVAVFFIGLGVSRPKGIGSWPKINRTYVAWPGLKVGHPEYEIALLLMKELPPGSPVMTPLMVGWMIPTFRHRLGAVLPAKNAVRHTILHQLADAEDADRRLNAIDMADGVKPLDVPVLIDLVRRYAARGVVLSGSEAALADGPLREMGFTAPRQFDQYRVWVRP